jgi:hypothetical protein
VRKDEEEAQKKKESIDDRKALSVGYGRFIDGVGASGKAEFIKKTGWFRN